MPATIEPRKAKPAAAPLTVRAAEVARLTGMSLREVWRKAADGSSGFPGPRKLSPRVTVWNYADVVRWVEERTNA
jgi:predicted DNA-binding transcriptional regulator AlpA